MRRISTIRSSREASLEKRREELRNLRWARRRSQLLTVATLASVAALLFAKPTPQQLVQVMEKILAH